VSSTVNKALALLGLFSQARPEIGLSEIARLAKNDKATTHRMLAMLAKHGLIEQNINSRLYRLGAGTLRLARMREASFPIATIIEPLLRNLSESTGETVHASLVAGDALATVGVITSRKAIHVSMGAGDSLPFHATASGIAVLAFLPEEHVKLILQNRLSSFTEHTPTQSQDLTKLVSQARQRGYAVAEQSYEADVIGIASPFFSAEGIACGAVAVATPIHRMTREIRASTIRAVLETATALTRRTGVEPPEHFMSIFRKMAA
jgi:IclR family transcriptional regulator, acetate operon repressor